jgi:hypothetical protein
MAGVNKLGAEIRADKIWLPKRNTNTNTLVESPTGVQISTLLTEPERVESRDFRGWVKFSMIKY